RTWEFMLRSKIAEMMLAVEILYSVTAARAQPFTTLHSFDLTDGANPYAELVQATDGNLSGTTIKGGADVYGTAFKITLSGTLTTLHSFDGTDGADPDSSLIQASNGNFYGTTSAGGTVNRGTVFKITLSGTLTKLHNFVGDPTDGNVPDARLV